MRRMMLMIGAVALLAGAAPAAAHGDAAHAGKDAVPVRKEQKPWGIAGDAKDARRTVRIAMLDTMRYSPDVVHVRLGDTIRFVHRNRGKTMHEFVLGTKQELDEHAALMLKFPDMEHDEPYMAHVPPGKTGEIVWQFNRAGTFEFACLIPGHYQAGMVGRVIVTDAK